MPISHTELFLGLQSSDLLWDHRCKSCRYMCSLFPIQKLWIALGIKLGLLHISIWSKPLPFSSKQDCSTSNKSTEWEKSRKVLIPNWSCCKKWQKQLLKKQPPQKLVLKHTALSWAAISSGQLSESMGLASIQTSNTWYPPPTTNSRTFRGGVRPLSAWCLGKKVAKPGLIRRALDLKVNSSGGEIPVVRGRRVKCRRGGSKKP